MRIITICKKAEKIRSYLRKIKEVSWWQIIMINNKTGIRSSMITGIPKFRGFNSKII